MGTEPLPTAPEALARSIAEWNAARGGDDGAARYWLAVATELRKGSASATSKLCGWRGFDGIGADDDPGCVRRPGHAGNHGFINDSGEHVTGPDANECRDCGGELIRRADGPVHRRTYRAECELAYSIASPI